MNVKYQYARYRTLAKKSKELSVKMDIIQEAILKKMGRKHILPLDDHSVLVRKTVNVSAHMVSKYSYCVLREKFIG